MKALISRIKKLEGTGEPGEAVDCIMICGKAHASQAGSENAFAIFVGTPVLPQLVQLPQKTEEEFDARLSEVLASVRRARELPCTENAEAFEAVTRKIETQNARHPDAKADQRLRPQALN